METARCSICGEEHPVATMVTAHNRPEELPDAPAGDVVEPVGWWLQDGEALNASYPRSFFIPPRERREALREGECVRLGFEYGPHADREGEGHVERMWVEVAGPGRGRLRNTPFRLTALAIGDVVELAPEHVLAIDYTDEELGYPQEEVAVVDDTVIRADRAPEVVVRGPSPDVAGEQAWWLLTREGSEPRPETLAAITDRFPGLGEPLQAGTGLWELAGGERETARWRRVSDAEVEADEGRRGLLEWLDEAARSMRG
jgi:hypothetical protein